MRLTIRFYGIYILWTEVWLTIVEESGWNLWVWLVGVVSRRRVWLLGGIYGCSYWLECIGVISGCCKEVNRYPHNN